MKKLFYLLATVPFLTLYLSGCIKGADQQNWDTAAPVMATSISENEPKEAPVLWPSWKLPDEISEFTEGTLKSVFSGERYALLTFSGVTPEEFTAYTKNLKGVSFYVEEEEAYFLAKIGTYTLRMYFFIEQGVMQLHAYEETIFPEWQDLKDQGVPEEILLELELSVSLPYGAEYKKIRENPEENITEHFELYYSCIFAKQSEISGYFEGLLNQGWSGAYPRIQTNMEMQGRMYTVTLEYLGREEGLDKLYCRYEKKSG